MDLAGGEALKRFRAAVDPFWVFRREVNGIDTRKGVRISLYGRLEKGKNHRTAIEVQSTSTHPAPGRPQVLLVETLHPVQV